MTYYYYTLCNDIITIITPPHNVIYRGTSATGFDDHGIMCVRRIPTSFIYFQLATTWPPARPQLSTVPSCN